MRAAEDGRRRALEWRMAVEWRTLGRRGRRSGGGGGVFIMSHAQGGCVPLGKQLTDSPRHHKAFWSFT